MATAKSPYAQIYSGENQQPQPTNQYYTNAEVARIHPDVEQAEKERYSIEKNVNDLISSGMGPDSALILAKQLNDTQKKANAIKFQEQLLAAQDAQLSLDNHQKRLNTQSRLNSFSQGLNDISHKNLDTFNEQLESHQANHLDVLSDPEIGSIAQKLVRDKFKSHYEYGKAVTTQMQRFGLPGVLPETLDENGEPNMEKVRDVASKMKTSEFAEKLQKQKQLSEVAENTRIAVNKARIAEQEAAKQQNPLYKKKLQLESIRLRQGAEDAITREYKNHIIASGISPENAKYLGREIGEGDATGKKVQGGDHYLYKDNKGKTFALPKESVDYLKQRSLEYRDMMENIDQLSRPDSEVGGQVMESSDTTDGQDWKNLF